MSKRMVPTWLIVTLALGAGGLAGVAIDQLFIQHRLRNEWQSRLRLAANSDARHSNPTQWHQDSVRDAAWKRLLKARPDYPPVEVGRLQALNHCVVRFAIRDTTYQRLQLFRVDAWNRSATGVVVARGYTYTPDGLREGDTVNVVVPEVWCGDIVVGSYGAGTFVPPPALGLDVR